MSLTRREFLRAAGVGALGLVGASASGADGAGADPRARNVLLMTADDLGPHLGCYGDATARSPNLDALAGEGVRFRNACVTQASCSPSRSSIFTGRYPHENGQLGLAHRGYCMHPDQQTLTKVLRSAGYRCGVIGKVHVQPAEDVAFDWTGIGHGKTRDVHAVHASASQFLDGCASDPWMLMVNVFDPHRKLFDQVEGLPEEPFTGDDVRAFPFLGLNDADVREEVAGYYNCATRVDMIVGLLMEELQRRDVADDTMVIFLGDHGPPFTRAKTSCYEAGVRIPLIVRPPGGCAARATDALVSTVDLLPTIAAATGAELARPVTGRSLMPLLRSPGGSWRDTLCCEFNTHGPRNWYPRRSIHDARFKLIHNLLPGRESPIKGVDGCAAWAASRRGRYEGTWIREMYDTYHAPPEFELYDLHDDPIEHRNLAGAAAYAGVEARLRDALRRWREETSDPLLDEATLRSMTRRHDELREAGAERYTP